MSESAPLVSKTKRGRLPELDKPDVREKIIDALRWGNYRHDAAAYAGIDVTTFMRYLAQGRKEKEGPYRQFLHAVEKAESEAKVRALQHIRKAGEEPRHWTAEAWFLERRHPKDFSRRMIVEAEGVMMEETRLTTDEGRAMAEGIKRTLAAFRVRAIEGGSSK